MDNSFKKKTKICSISSELHIFKKQILACFSFSLCYESEFYNPELSGGLIGNSANLDLKSVWIKAKTYLKIGPVKPSPPNKLTQLNFDETQLFFIYMYKQNVTVLSFDCQIIKPFALQCENIITNSQFT